MARARSVPIAKTMSSIQGNVCSLFKDIPTFLCPGFTYLTLYAIMLSIKIYKPPAVMKITGRSNWLLRWRMASNPSMPDRLISRAPCRVYPGGLRQGSLRTIGCAGMITSLLQVERQAAPHQSIIVNNQDMFSHATLSSVYSRLILIEYNGHFRFWV